MTRVVVFGLGKLGSAAAAVFAAAGHEVVGVDLDEAVVHLVSQRVAPFVEPGLQELMDDPSAQLSAEFDGVAALQGAEISVVIVPTPSGTDGAFVNDFVASVFRTIGDGVRDDDRHHTVILSSTVMPGSCSTVLAPLLEKSSGKRLGDGIGLAYSPEFIALGSIVHDMQQPDLVLIGESDKLAGDVAEAFYRSVIHRDAPVRRMALVNAELVKLAINTYVTTKISFANMMAEICDQLPEADAGVVLSAVGDDSRIGSKYLRPGLGFGGPCFPRDNQALAVLAASLGVDASIATATRVVNDRQVDRVCDLVGRIARVGAPIAILGLTYKPGTTVTESSQPVPIANSLYLQGFAVTVHDPHASLPVSGLSTGVAVASTAADAVGDAEVVLVATPWSEYSTLPAEFWSGKLVIDPWNVISHEGPLRVLVPGSLERSEGAPSIV